MSEKRLSRSIRKFLRRKKAEIRQQFLNLEESEPKVKELVERVFKEYSKVEAKVTKVANVSKV